ncbi:MAG: histidine kinase dimerization/phosphoacceptor domain -containing protein [Chitinophagaceae bacterium]
MYKYLLLLLSALLGITSIAQNSTVLEIEKNLLTTTVDSVANKNINKLINQNPPTKPKEIISVLTKSMERFEKLQQNNVLQNIYLQTGISFRDLRKYDTSILFFRKAEIINSLTRDKETQGFILHEIGYWHYEQNILDSALIYYYKALNVRKQNNTPRPIAVTLNAIGLVFRTRNQLSNAKDFYFQALPIFEKLEDAAALRCLSNIATIYNLEKKYDSATALYLKIYNTAKAKNDVGNMLFSQVNMALGYNFQEKYAQALPVFEELSNNPRVKAIEDLNNAVQYGLGQAYMGVKNYDKAIPILKTCLGYRFKNTKYQSLAAITNLLYTAEKEKGNYQQALVYYEQLKVYSDSLMNKNRSDAIDELDKKYKTEQKEQQILILAKENAIKDLTLKQNQQTLQLALAKSKQKEQEIDLLNKQNEVSALLVKQHEQTINLEQAENQKSAQALTILQKENAIKDLSIKEKKRTNWLFAIGLIIAIGIAFGIWTLYRNKQKTAKLLQEKNDIISKALGEKEILLKEIHHRVKNNLQVVSSLLNLQSRKINDEKALSAIKEGRDRVKSMALIHQNLYRDDNLTGVEIKDYIEKLVQSLFTSYNIQNEKVRLQTEIDDLNVDVDTVIPIGLILTELISNALKYAFDETKQDGKLVIKLKQDEAGLSLNVKDNGIGLPNDWNYEKADSLGYQLIRSFAAKMKAKLTITGNDGTNVEMLITNYKLTA